MSKVVDIDGSVYEGGGQILRIALCLSCLKKIPVRIFNIRASRNKPGLMEQHLKGVQLMSDICRANVRGAELGSSEITFHPGDIVSGLFKSYIRTAGSITLLLQVVLPCTLSGSAETTLNLHGGTNTELAPQIDYATEVFRPNLEKFGATFDFDLIRRGYFPKGGGEVIINVKPVDHLNGVNLVDQGKITSIQGWSFVAGTLPMHLSYKMADGAKNVLSKHCRSIEIECYKEDRNIAPDNASGIILVAHTDTGCVLGSSALGKRSENSENTGARAANELLKSIEEGACVDEHCQDQIIILMAIARGPSSIKVGKVTLHTETAIYVIEKLTKVQFKIEPANDGGTIIHCNGMV